MPSNSFGDIAIDSLPQDHDVFKHANATKNYSKKDPQMNFVEEYPDLNIEMAEIDVDPLQINDERDDIIENIAEKLSPMPSEIALEIITETKQDQVEPNIICEPIMCVQSTCDISMQTEPVKEESQNPLSLKNLKHNNKLIHFYTGLERFEKLQFVFYTLGDCTNLKYFYETPLKPNPFEQFFMALVILRRHKEFEEIATLYNISIKQVSNIFITWVRLMALQWKTLDLWVDRDTITSYMPLDFYDKYPMTRVVIDATECPIKKPGLPLAQQVTFSTYKNRNTVKFLVGIAPSGLITYVSPCYGGSASDRQIIERSSILDKFNPDDEIMVDKGLNVQDIFMGYGVKVNMPSFFKKGNQIQPQTLSRDRKVASKRVHVERVIGMLKTYKILKQPLNITETLLSSDIAFVWAMLVNFRSNIVNKCS